MQRDLKSPQLVKAALSNPPAPIIAPAVIPQITPLQVRLHDGFCGLYELSVMRPHLRQWYDRFLFLPTLIGHLEAIIASYAETGNNVRESEGMSRFQQLIAIVVQHNDSLLLVCPEDAAARYLVIQLTSLTNDTTPRFYQLLRGSLHAHVRTAEMPFVSLEALKDHVITKAQVISATIPKAMKGDAAVIGMQIAAAFLQHKDHGGGAKVSGGPELGIRWQDEWFGEGPTGDLLELFTSADVNPFSDVSLALIPNPKLREITRRNGQKCVNDYYNNHQLTDFHVRGLPNFLTAARGTVRVVVMFELSRLQADSAQQIMQQIPRLTKEAILFGIQNGIIQRVQLAYLNAEYSLNTDPDLFGALETMEWRRVQEDSGLAFIQTDLFN